MDRTKKTSAFSLWIFKSFRLRPEGSGLYRIFCGLFLLLFLLPPVDIYVHLSAMPNELFAPLPGPMLFFNGFPPYPVFIVLHSLLIVSLCLMVLGWQTKVTSLLSGITLLVIKGFIYSVGKANHDLLIMIVPILMAFSGWGQAYSLDAFLRHKKQQVQGWTLTLLVLILGFMFFTAGFSKLIGGWLNFDSHATLGHLFRQYFVYGRQDLLASYSTSITSPVVWELFDYLTVLFEIGFLAAVFHPRTTRIFVCLAVLFHFSIMMILNISFLPNFLAYAAFLNWPWINKKITVIFESYKHNAFQKYMPPLFIVAFMILLWGLIKWLSPFIHFNSDLQPEEFIILCCCLPIAVYYLSSQVIISAKNFLNLK